MRNKLRSKYIESDYDRLHTRLVESEINETELDKVVDVRTGCIFDTKTITSGSIREVEVFPIYLKKEMPSEWRRKESKEARKNLNNKNAEKNFIRKLNTNFKKKDYYLTLEYQNKFLPKGHDEARKHMHKFIRKLNNLYKKEQKKNGVTDAKIQRIKYMFVTEYSDVKKIRCHHHMVMNAVLPLDVVEEAWEFGNRTKISFLSPDDMGLTGLATYLSKDPKGKKRWCCSRNLKDPHVTRSLNKFSKKKIRNMATNHNSIKEEMEKANPGYIFVDAQVYINEFNGMPYIYARMRKLN